ncbi:hypothetical protein ACFOET_05595, partial [Parapedobacter deserti]
MKDNAIVRRPRFFTLNILCVVIGVMSATLPALAQEQVGLRERAEELYGRFEYANAAALYAKLADSRK